jgi:hypothetical protein
MTCNYNASFQNVDKLGTHYLSLQLEENLKSFLNWGFLNIGGFININRPTSNISNNLSFHKLLRKEDPAYKNGQVWETFKKQWIYETGVSYSGYSPIEISGVYVNDTFVPGPTGEAPYNFTMNYDLGRVTFSSGLPTSTNVQMDFSYRNIQVYKANENLSEWKTLQEFTYKRADVDKSITANHRIQPPCIIVEPINSANFKPYQLGSLTYRANQDVLLHIFTENYADRNNIVDIIRLQKEKNLKLYDINSVIKNKVYYLNKDGSLNTDRMNYDQLFSDDSYFWRMCFISDTSIIDYESLNYNIFYSTIRLSLEIIL